MIVHDRVATRGDLRFPVREYVPPGEVIGAPFLLLHGWPQDARSWHEVAQLLAAAGHRVFVPNLRGAAPEAAPRWRWQYRTSELIADVAAIVDLIGEPVHLVGHDWGAALAWNVAVDRPDLARTLTAVSVPHVGAFLKAMVRSSQLPHSCYMGLFNLPLLPELLLGRPSLAAWMLRRTGASAENAARDAARLTDRRIARGGFNWYRAGVFTKPAIIRGSTPLPVLQVWSDGDTAVVAAGPQYAADFVTGTYRLVTLTGRSHWIPDEAPEQLAALIVEHTEAHR